MALMFDGDVILIIFDLCVLFAKDHACTLDLIFKLGYYSRYAHQVCWPVPRNWRRRTSWYQNSII